MRDAQYWIEQLKLDKLEEIGGYFRSHLKSEQTISQMALPEGSDERRFWEMNYYLLQNSEVNTLHQLKEDEKQFNYIVIGSGFCTLGFVERVLKVENVYITGASLWPTGGSWNPTLTMVALAQDLADNLTEQAKETKI